MNRLLSACWRWLLILAVYIVLAVPVTGLVVPGPGGESLQIPMIFQGALRSAAYASGYFPDNVYYEDWQVFCSSYAMNCVFISLALVVLWNLLYAPFALGRNHENSARAMVWVFTLLHIAILLGYAFYVFTLASYIWAWIIRQPTGLNLMLLMPLWVTVPFTLSIRALCPYRVHHVFPLLAKARERLGLRVYSRRGAR